MCAKSKQPDASASAAAQKPSPRKSSRGPYNSTLKSLIDIWNVLAAHATPDKPMTIGSIAKFLSPKSNSGAKASLTCASRQTLERLDKDIINLLNNLFPNTVLRNQGEAAIPLSYEHMGKLYAVLSAPGKNVPCFQGEMIAVFHNSAVNPISLPSLSRMLPDWVNDFESYPNMSAPISLAGVIAKKTLSGPPVYIPATRWADNVDKLTDSQENQDFDVPIKQNHPTRYYYLQSILSPEEWRILSDLILVYPYISEEQTKKFLSAMMRLAPGVKEWSGQRYAPKVEYSLKFELIKVLDQAIRDHCLVCITYGRYQLGLDKNHRLRPQLQAMPNEQSPGKPYIMTVEPYAMMWSNGYYYLVCKLNGSMRNLRVDRIIEAKAQRKTFEKDPQFDPYQYRDRSPVMYPGKPVDILLRCPLSMLSTLMDFFGTTIRDYSTPREPESLPLQQRYTEVSLLASEAGTRLFALQYADQVEVLSPPSLREEVRKTLEAAAQKYRT